MAVPRNIAARPTTLMASSPWNMPAPTKPSTENCDVSGDREGAFVSLPFFSGTEY
jgi:hypothetical protein